MKREELRNKLTDILSAAMSGGINFTQAERSIWDLFNPGLPPAEGAEHDIEAMRRCLHHYVNVDEVNRYDVLVFGAMRDYADDFAAQQQPTAEGAEEILDKYPHSTEYPSFIHENSAIAAMHEFATLHAQRLAEKMVEERLRVQWSGYGELGNISQKPLQLTAEGKEVDKERALRFLLDSLDEPEYIDKHDEFSQSYLCIATIMERFATLHVQQMAEKMVEWVSVKDKLPEERENVLCYNGYRISSHNWCKHTDQDDDWFKKTFTHWCKLPKTP